MQNQIEATAARFQNVWAESYATPFGVGVTSKIDGEFKVGEKEFTRLIFQGGILVGGGIEMQIKLGVLINATPALKKLVSAELPVSIAFSLSKSLKAMDGELATHEEQRQSLVRKHGTGDDQGNFTVSPERYESFFADLLELNNVEVDIPFTPISIAKLSDDVKISAVDLSLLSDAGFVTE